MSVLDKRTDFGRLLWVAPYVKPEMVEAHILHMLRLRYRANFSKLSNSI